MTSVHEINISGIKIPFPHEKPYPAQTAIMANTIRAMRTSQNAVLESPTGTGKSAALLASSLSFQKIIKEYPLEPPPMIDPPPKSYLGFFPPKKFQLPGAPVYHPLLSQGMKEKDIVRYMNDDGEADYSLEYEQEFAVSAKQHQQQIWYSSRTHQQLKQLIRELKKLPYHPQVCIMASREKVCVNKRVAESGDADGGCANLRKEGGCPYDKHKSIPKEFKPYGIFDKFELEELKDFCKRNKYCPYNVSRLMMKSADIVFCPYNYFLDPKVKGQMQLDLTGVFLIIDEAHNIEGHSREGGTFHHSRDTLNWSMMYMRKQMKMLPTETPKKRAMAIVLDIILKQFRWFDEITKVMRNTEKYEYVAPNNMEVLDAWSLDRQKYDLLVAAFDCIFKLGNIVNTPQFISEMEGEKIAMRLSGHLEQLWVMLAIFFHGNMEFINHYRITISIDSNPNNDTLHGLVMNPTPVFKGPADEASSIILASGTMSPLSTFTLELGQPFPIQLSAPHVIQSNQFLGFTITNGMDGTQLSSTHSVLEKGGQRGNVNISIGNVLLFLLPSIPNGVLFFFPSYNFIERMIESWKNNGIYDKLLKIKTIFIESQEPDPNFFTDYKEAALSHGGALLIGVFRGKSSEGIDFLDEQARAVFAFGIPFPSYLDIEVRLKREYNESIQKGSGKEWYETQAYRALFQAIGRCIRHQNDYGSVILIDSRFPNELERFPRWMKPCIQVGVPINQIRDKFLRFYSEMNSRFPSKVALQVNKPLSLYCSDCHRIVLNIHSLCSDKTISSSLYQGFQKITFTEMDDQFLLVKDENIEIHLLFEPNIYSQQDQTSYERARCQCGKCVGARVFATTSSMAGHLNHLWIIINRVRTMNSGCMVEIISGKKIQTIGLGLASNNQTQLVIK